MTTPTAPTTAQYQTPSAKPQAVRIRHRARDFGVGYGNSSGYATGKRYTKDWGHARFVCG